MSWNRIKNNCIYILPKKKKKTWLKYRCSTKKWNDLRRLVFSLYGSSCMRCKSNKDLQIDHIRPASRENQLVYHIENMQVLCKKCNSKKGNKHIKDYRESKDKKILYEAIKNEPSRFGPFLNFYKNHQKVKTKARKEFQRKGYLYDRDREIESKALKAMESIK